MSILDRFCLTLKVTLAAALVLASAWPEPATAFSSQSCVDRKLRASSRALSCYLREKTGIIRGREVDTARCDEKLLRAFEKADATGGCATTGDFSVSLSRVSTAADAVFDHLAVEESAPAEAACVREKTNATIRYARCQTAALGKRIARTYRGEKADFKGCRSQHAAAFAALESSFLCPTTGEAAEVQDSSSGGFAYLPDFHWGSTERCAYVRCRYPVDAPLANAYLRNNIFSHSFLNGATFFAADLTGADLSHTITTGTDMREADLTGVDLSAAILKGDLSGAELDHAKMRRLRATKITGCPAVLPDQWVCRGTFLLGPFANLRSESLDSIDLSNVDLSGADLFGATMIESNVSGAVFDGATMKFADLTNTTAVNTNFANTILDQATFDGADLLGASFASAGLRWTGWINSRCPDGTVVAGGGCCPHLIDSPAVCSLTP